MECAGTPTSRAGGPRSRGVVPLSGAVARQADFPLAHRIAQLPPWPTASFYHPTPGGGRAQLDVSRVGPSDVSIDSTVVKSRQRVSSRSGDWKCGSHSAP
jgi:hypothetical protein